MRPNRRGSLKRTTVPSSSVRITWSCFTSGSSGPAAVMRPDMPRCSKRSPVASSSTRMYLPRRDSPPISAPSSRLASIGGNGRRRSGRRNSARTIRRPVMRNARPRRTVSTSGSSGIERWLARCGRGYCSCPMNAPETSDNSAGLETEFGFLRVPEAAKAPLVRAVFDSVAERYDLMNDLMSGGIHRWWKAEMVRWLGPRPGQLLVDVAGGTGDIARRALPRLDSDRGGGVIVCDANPQMLEIGRARALDDGILAGIEWLGGDAEALPFADRSFDLYTIAFGLRNVTRLDRALTEARRILKPGGRFLCLEFTPAVAPPLQPLYDFYSFQVLPLLGQIVTGNREAYAYLAESIRRFPPQSALAERIAASGLDRVRYRNLTGGIAALHSAWRL